MAGLIFRYDGNGWLMSNVSRSCCMSCALHRGEQKPSIDQPGKPHSSAPEREAKTACIFVPKFVRLIPLGSGRRNPPWTACRAKAVARRSLGHVKYVHVNSDQQGIPDLYQEAQAPAGSVPASPVTTPVRFSQVIQLVQVHIPTMCRLSNTGCRVEELYASDMYCSYHAASAPGQFSGDMSGSVVFLPPNVQLKEHRGTRTRQSYIVYYIRT
ncbi:hypothetical protein A9K55_001561 [Cordyceps militaris]|uniref:Uncharacterized protein n=1 Tax=Cordyceps militaris TaxID=73501 RepID=A0A2H4SSX4_CORMI|nr:hypothetical protein A9K55_001561 [Cordyceps militaris]